MMIIPSDNLLPYISTGENGEWIHDPNMPQELMGEFEKFVVAERVAREETTKL